MDIDGVEESSRQVQVRFVTKLKPPYKAPSTTLAIPTNITRLRLSDIVNNILEAGTVLYAFYLFFRFLRFLFCNK